MKEPKQVVSAVPEFTDVVVDLETDQFVVLGTDGVFDFIPVQTIGDIVACADRTEDGLTRAAESIVALARSNGSTDDRTCVIIDFAWAKRPDRENLKISNTYIR
jgi:serine/threonine protein phosphatase PrpC